MGLETFVVPYTTLRYYSWIRLRSSKKNKKILFQHNRYQIRNLNLRSAICEVGSITHPLGRSLELYVFGWFTLKMEAKYPYETSVTYTRLYRDDNLLVLNAFHYFSPLLQIISLDIVSKQTLFSAERDSCALSTERKLAFRERNWHLSQ